MANRPIFRNISDVFNGDRMSLAWHTVKDRFNKSLSIDSRDSSRQLAQQRRKVQEQEEAAKRARERREADTARVEALRERSRLKKFVPMDEYSIKFRKEAEQKQKEIEKKRKDDEAAKDALAKKIAKEQTAADEREWAKRFRSKEFTDKRRAYYEHLEKEAEDSFLGQINKGAKNLLWGPLYLGMAAIRGIAGAFDDDVRRLNVADAAETASNVWKYASNPYDAVFGDQKGQDEANIQKGKAMNVMGAFLGGMTSAYTSAQVGKISDSKLRQEEAKAFIDLLEKQNEYDRLATQYQNAITNNDHNALQSTVDQMKAIEGELAQLDQTYKDLAEQYKVDYVDDKFTSFGQKIHEWAGEVTAYSPNDAEQFRQNVRNRKIAEFNGDMSKDPTAFRDKANAYIKEQDALQKEYRENAESGNKWNDAMSRALPQTEAYKNAASRMMKAGVAPSLTDIDQLYLTMPSTAGSSSSSWNTLAGTALDLASVPVASAGPIGAMVAGGMQLASSYYNYQGGKEENYAEAADAQIENFYNYMNLPENESVGADILEDIKKKAKAYYKKNGYSDEWIAERFDKDGEQGAKNAIQDYLTGVVNNESPMARKAAMESMRGIRAMREADDISTMSEEMVRLPMNLAGNNLIQGLGSAMTLTGKYTGKLLGKGVGIVGKTTAGKAINKAASKVGGSAFGRVMKESAEDLRGFANGIKNAAKNMAKRTEAAGDLGSDLGAMTGTGYFGTLIGDATGRVAKEGVQLAKDALPASAKYYLDRIGSASAHGYQYILDHTPESVRLLGKYGVKTAKNLAVSSLQEGGEEGRQYLNSQKDWSKYGFGSANVADYIVNDLVNGSRVTQAYLSAVGLGNSDLDNDVEFWTNVKGGMAAGWGTPGIGQAVSLYKGANGIYREYTTNRELNNSAILNREAAKYDRAADREFVRMATAGRQQEALDWLQRSKEDDARRETPKLSQLDYDELIEDAKGIMSHTKRKDVRGTLEARGINYGSDDYAYAVSEMYHIDKEKQANANESRQVESEISKHIAASRPKRTNEEYNDSSIPADILKRANEAADKATENEDKRLTEAGTDAKEKKLLLREFHEQRKKEAIKQELGQLDVKNDDILRNAASLVAAKLLLEKFNNIDSIFKYTKEVLGIKSKRPDAKLIRKRLEAAQKEAGKSLQDIADSAEVDLEDFKTQLAMELGGRELTDEMIEAATKELMLQADMDVLDNAMSSYTRDVVVNKDGKYELNHKKYSAQMKRAERMAAAMQSGDIALAMAIRGEQDENFDADSVDTEKDSAHRRIAALRKANEDNQRIGWMLSEIVSGDAVTKLQEILEDDWLKIEQEELKAQRAEQKSAEQSAKQEATPATASPEAKPTTESKPTAPKSAARAERFERAKKRREEAKKKSKHFEKKSEEWKQRRKEAKEKKKRERRGRLNDVGSLVGMMVEDLMDMIFDNAVYSAYKIAEFYYDVKAIAQDNGNDVSSIDDETNGIIKQIYARAKNIALRGKDKEQYADHFSSKEEILAYQPVPQTKDPEVKDENKGSVADAISKMQSKVDTALSTVWDVIVDGVIYQNQNAQNYDTRLTGDEFNKIVAEVNSDPVAALDKYQIPDLYLKYKDLGDFAEMIAHIATTASKSPYLKYALQSQQWVIDILSGGNTDGIPQLFVSKIQDIKASWDNAGYKIIATNPYVFGENGAAQPQVILEDSMGNAHVVIVSSSYGNIMNMWDRPQFKGARYTKGEFISSNMKYISDILAKNGINVASTRLISVTNDGPGKQFVNAEYVVDANKQMQDYEDLKQNLDTLRQNVAQIVGQLNSKIEEYNSYAEQVEGEAQMQLAEERTYTNEQDYLNYIAELQAKLDGMDQSIADIIQKAQDAKDQPKPIVYKFEQLSSDISRNSSISALTLQDKCMLLDQMLEDADNLDVDAFQGALIDAQIALTEVLVDSDHDINVENEESVIMAAMQQVRLNDRFRDRKYFLAGWWIYDLTMGPHDTASYEDLGRLAQMYKNQLANIAGVMSQYVLADIQGSKDLQRLYSAILNNHLPNLLRNAQDVIDRQALSVTDDATVANIHRTYAVKREDAEKVLSVFSSYILNLLKQQPYITYIDILNALITDFNDQWGVAPDTSIEGPTEEAKAINQLPIKWHNLYGESNEVSPSLYGKATMKNGSQALSGMHNTQKYKIVGTAPDFATNTTFTFGTYTDSVGVWYHYKGIRGEYSDFLKITGDPSDLLFDGQTQQEKVDAMHKANAMARFEDKIRKMLAFCKSHPGYKISFTTHVHKGRIQYDYSASRRVDDVLFGGDQEKIYNIKVGKEDGVGIIVCKEHSTVASSREIFAGDDLSVKIGQLDDTYQKLKSTIASGTMVYMYPTGVDAYGNLMHIPVPMPNVQWSTIPNAVDEIYGLIKAKANNQPEYMGFNTDALLDLVFHIDDADKLNPMKSIASVVKIENGIFKVGTQEFSVNDISQIGAIKKQIGNMYIPLAPSKLNLRVGDESNPVFNKVKALFTFSGKSEVHLPFGITIKSDDVSHENSDGTTGCTWLGCLMRNGYIRTNMADVEPKYVSFGNLEIVKDDDQKPATVLAPQAPAEAPAAPVQQLGSQANVSLMNSARAQRFARMQALRNGGLNKTTDYTGVVTRSGDERQQFIDSVNEFFDQVFGSHDDVEFADSILEPVEGGRVVLGKCGSSFIALSTQAPESAAFHEAFHKVLELMVPEKQREEMYRIYRSKFKGNLSERDVAEGLCDMFTDWMTLRSDYSKMKGFAKIKGFFRKLAFNAGLVWRLGIKNYFTFMGLYKGTVNGRYIGQKPSKKAVERFERLFGESLHYEHKDPESGEKIDFGETIANTYEYKQIIEAVSVAVIEAYTNGAINPNFDKFIIDGQTPERLKKAGILDSLMMDPSMEIIFRSAERPKLAKNKETGKFEPIVYRKDGNTSAIMETFYPNWNAIAKDVADYCTGIVSEYHGKFNELPEDKISDPSELGGVDADLEEVMKANIDKYDKAAYEFSKLESTTAQVKQFFATMYNMTVDENGEFVKDYSRNLIGSATFIPMIEAFNRLVKDFHDATSLDDLLTKMQKMQSKSPIHKQAYQKLYALVNGTSHTEQVEMLGQTVTTEVKDSYGIIKEDGTIDYDKQAFALSILSCIRSQLIDFTVALTTTDKNGNKSTRVTSSSTERDAASYPRQWTDLLLSGTVPVFDKTKNNGKLVFVNREALEKFDNVANFIENLAGQFRSPSDHVTIDGQNYNKILSSANKVIKVKFLDQLHSIGIMMSPEALDYMLEEKYGSSSLTTDASGNTISALLAMFDEAGKANIGAFVSNLRQLSNDSKGTQDMLKDGYTKFGFVKELGLYQGQWKRQNVQTTALAFDGKTLHTTSQHNSITHILQQLNTHDPNNDVLRILGGFGYNYSKVNGQPIGSIILKQCLSKSSKMITAHTFIGSKTDNAGDKGTEYQKSPAVDDYISKMAILQSGAMIFPTLADKGTWMYLTGVDIPGMTFKKENDEGALSVSGAPKLVYDPNKGIWYIRPNDSVLNQILQYCITERNAIQECMEDLGYEDIPGYIKTGKEPIPQEAYIKNYHTKDKATGEAGGTRFLTLTEIHIPGEAEPINLNDPNKSSVELLKLANEKLFNKPYEELLEIIANTLQIQNTISMERAEKLGVVTKNTDGSWSSKHLNQNQIQALTVLMMTDAGAPANQYQVYESIAIQAIIADVNNRSIISAMETERCFSGHPGMFKVEYDKKKGVIKDSTFDIQKRIGGMVSTGDDNIVDGIPGITKTYTCAEIDDYEVGTPVDALSVIRDKFLSSAIRETLALEKQRLREAASNLDSLRNLAQLLRDKRRFARHKEDIDLLSRQIADIEKQIREFLNSDTSWEDVYGSDSIETLTFEQASELLKQLNETAYNKAVADANTYANAYADGINVADGASYITQDMCKNMLMMRGAYTAKVDAAFKLLESEHSVDWVKQAEAYNTIYEAVNLVPTKYTAYGVREHTLSNNPNGQPQRVSNVAVAYYNKFALFPIFDCMATGKMKDVYAKMRSEGVDMMFMNSAVKVGSQGSTKYKTIDEMLAKPFNKYTQDITFLRRQLNTDPEEGDRIAAGTQMIKIAMANLRTGRKDYIHNGAKISGQGLLAKFMYSINKLADIGNEQLKEEFYGEDGEVDAQKLSDFLKSQLTARNANKGLIEAILVTKGEDGQPKLVCPLSATADASWIESILISAINKRTVDINLPGSSFIQRSVFAIEDEDGSGAIQGLDAYNGQKLNMLNEDGSMDSVISMDYFESVFPKSLRGKSFAEKRQWLIDNNFIGPNAKAETVGYRIPTQAQSSIHGLRFVDVLPATKSTIILPKEFTKTTGSDFDIDHLYLVSYNHTIDENGNASILRSTDVKEDAPIQDRMNAYQNDMLDCMMTLLQDGESMNSLYKSIDNDTGLIEDKAALIPEVGSTKSHAFNFGCLHELVIRKNDYLTGKVGIGPFALNATSHMLTCAFKLKWKSNAFTDSTFLKHLHYVTDSNGDYISSWLSGFINAHVDIVKDPYVSRINVNQFTYNMINLLVRSGQGEAGVWLLSQPVIRAMADASNEAGSQYTKDLGESQWQRKERLTNQALSIHGVDNSSINELRHPTDAEQEKKAIDAINSVFNSNFVDVMRHFATHPDDVDGIYNGYSYTLVQQMAFEAFSSLERYSQALSQLVQFTKIDTRKQGKTLMETQRYLKGYNNLITDSGTNLFDPMSMNEFVTGSWIDKKTRLAIQAPMDILGKVTFSANNAFVGNVFDTVDRITDSTNLENIDMLNTVSKHLQTAIKSQFILAYAKDYLGRSEKDISDLFVGDNTMSDRLGRLYYDARFTDKYSQHWTDENGQDHEYRYLQDNPLFQSLYQAPERSDVKLDVNGNAIPAPKFIGLSDSVDGSRLNEDLLIDGWEEMLNDPHKDVRDFARDLIIYAYLTSGEFKGWTKIAKYIPPSWIRGEIDTDVNLDVRGARCNSMSQFVEKVLSDDAFMNQFEFIDEIVANNCMNTSFVPRKSLTRHVDEHVVLGEIVPAHDEPNYTSSNNGAVLIGTTPISSKDETITTEEPDKHILVKRENSSGFDASQYNLYKLINRVTVGDDTYPIYTLVPKLGYSFKGNNIYQYGWQLGYEGNTYQSQPRSALQSIRKAISGEISANSKALKNANWTKLDPEYQSKYGAIAWANYFGGVYDQYTLYEERQRSNAGQQQQQMKADPKNYTNHSGGARGADTMWDQIGRQFGVTDHRHYRTASTGGLTGTLKQNGVNATIVDQNGINAARLEVAQLLGQEYVDKAYHRQDGSYDENKGDLKIRNWFQVKNADAVFAVTRVKQQGGTSAAIQYAITSGKPVHVFDLESEQWMTWNGSKWEVEDTPTLTPNFAGVGTRDIENYNVKDPNTGEWVPRKEYMGDQKRAAAEKAIRDVYQKTFFGDTNQRSYVAGQGAAAQRGESASRHPSVQPNNNINPEVLNTINVWSSEHNGYERLSNMADRPTPIGIRRADGTTKDVVFPSAEAAIQAFKLAFTPQGMTEETIKPFLEAKSGFEALKLGRSIQGLNRQAWDQNKKAFAKVIMKSSFVANDQDRMLLLSTGDATITHNQAANEWRTLFPEILTEIRAELQAEAGAAAQAGAATMSSQDTMLNEEEKKLWNYTGDMNSPRILVASEHTDPVLHAKEVIDTIEGRRKVKQWDNTQKKFVEVTGQDFAGAYMLTKHDGLPLRKILECKNRTGIPLILHFSITGNGGTAWEPGVMKPDDLMNRIESLVKEGLLDPAIVTFRIDPIIPGHLDRDMVNHIIARGKAMGITKFRFSVMDAYEQISMPQYKPDASGQMVDSRPDVMKNFDWDTYYGRETDQEVNNYNNWKCDWAVKAKRCTAEQAQQWKNEFYTTGKQNPEALRKGVKFKYAGNIKFEAKQQYIDEIMDFFEDIATNDPSIRIGTCAEHGRREHIKPEGCLSVESVNAMLGTTIQDEGTQNNTYRKECSCFGGKSDILAYTLGCASSCTYCYARHNDKKPLRYYNEDGTLKNNGLTVTSMQLLRDINDSKAYIDYVNSIPTDDQETIEIDKTQKQPASGHGIVYNAEQIKAIAEASAFLSLGDPKEFYVIEGKAGTGKTTIAKEVLKQWAKNHRGKVVVATLSHKANQVIQNSFDKETMKAVNPKFHTVALLFGLKLDEETGLFKPDKNPMSKPKIKGNDIILIDEASMINEEALNLIMTMKDKNAKVLFLGDRGQLPPIRPNNDPNAEKKSPVFETSNRSSLVTRVRQGEQNPILPFADHFWENNTSQNPAMWPIHQGHLVNSVNDGEGNMLFASDKSIITDSLVDAYKVGVQNSDPNYIKLVCYRNATRNQFNALVHQSIFGSEALAEGTPLIANVSYWPDPEAPAIFTNSEEFTIEDYERLNNYRGYDNIIMITIKIPGDTTYSIPVHSKESLRQFYKDLMAVKRAALDAPRGSQQAKSAWRQYYSMQGLVLTMNYGEQYPNENGVMQTMPSDIDYGYAITAHKSQGSTYTNVVVDGNDIMSVGPISARLKSEAIYTALTRARKTAIMALGGTSNSTDAETKSLDLVALANGEIKKTPAGLNIFSQEELQEGEENMKNCKR